MKYKNNISAIDELSASEGIFTTAQAERLDISRNALAHSCKTGHLERIARGAYRLAGTPSSSTDELTAIWKLTAPAAFSWERRIEWDGVTIGGTTAARLLEIGDFYLSPYRIYAPRRINSRIKTVSFGVRNVEEIDIIWTNGLPITRAERTLVDMCLDHEDPSLIEDAFHDAEAHGLIDLTRLGNLIGKYGKSDHLATLFAPLRKSPVILPHGKA